jgi:hypothetical protein
MNRTWLALLLVPLLLTGCARHYVLTLNNGAQIAARGKPKLQNGAYVFKDVHGKPVSVPGGRVREVAPASMVKMGQGTFTPSR